MAELSKYPRRERRFIESFPAGYNAIHGTAICGEPEQPTREAGWDYRWQDPESASSFVEVQHTVAASNADLERIHLRNAAQVNQAVCEHLSSRELRGYFVTICAEDTPRRMKDRVALIHDVCGEIDRCIDVGIPVGSVAAGKFRLVAEKHEISIEVGVRNTGGSWRATSIMSPTPHGYLENTTWRLAEAVRHKTDRIGGAKTEIALLVEFDLDGFDEEDVPLLVKELEDEDVPYREVWIADLSENTKLSRIWARA